MASPAPQGAPEHVHSDCGSRERLWLPADHREAATAARHPFCLECGTVKNITMPQAKPLGYYLDGLANLKESLEHSATYDRLVQVQTHLISQRLRARSEFEDPYGTPGGVQLDTYVNTVLAIRPDLDEDLILRMLPDRRRHRKPTSSQSANEQCEVAHPRN